MKSEDTKNYAMTLFYIAMAITVFIFAMNYGVTDWNDVAENLDHAIEKALYCEIDYGGFYGFHYKGTCTNREDILDFLDNMSQEQVCMR